MTVEVDEVEVVEAVEVVEQGEFGFVFGALGGAAEVLDDDPRVDLLLDVDRRGVGDEVLAVEFVLALPDELRVERGVARVADGDRLLDLRGDELLRARSAVGRFARLSAWVIASTGVGPLVLLFRAGMATLSAIRPAAR